jgi:hypothetical protein
MQKPANSRSASRTNCTPARHDQSHLHRNCDSRRSHPCIQGPKPYVASRKLPRLVRSPHCLHPCHRCFSLAALGYAFPTIALWALTIWATLTLLAATGLQTAGGLTQLRAAPTFGETWHSARPNRLARHSHPRISVLVPLFKKRDVATDLVEQLGRLDHQEGRLEALLILKLPDAMTADALANFELPGWMRIIAVPPGSPQTKPRALDYAFDFTDGEIIAVDDTEDAPPPSNCAGSAKLLPPRARTCLSARGLRFL